MKSNLAIGHILVSLELIPYVINSYFSLVVLCCFLLKSMST
jgi:hypothetical protein